MKNIVYFYASSFMMWRRRLAGIYAVARRAAWNVTPVDVAGIGRDIQSVVAYWHPDGVIVEGGVFSDVKCRIGMLDGLKAVFCDVDERKIGMSYTGVRQDSREVVKRAMQELATGNFSEYGYVHYRIKRDWTQERASCFLEITQELGGTGHVFTSWSKKVNQNNAMFIRRLADFLRGIPKPCGILAANDEMAAFVLRAADLSGIRVPDDMAVIGIDNDELICENTKPTLTSVTPAFERSGKTAAELLLRLLANPATAPCVISFGALPPVRRMSTRKVTCANIRVRRAQEFVRVHACDGITVDDVVRQMELKRRTAEKCFRQAVGRSIRDELIAGRIARAKELLLRSDLAVNSIYMHCGYHDERSLRYAFTVHEGVSPLAWRKAQGVRISS